MFTQQLNIENKKNKNRCNIKKRIIKKDKKIEKL